MRSNVNYFQSWSLAEAECQADGAELTSIVSRFEQAFVFSSLPSHNECAWIGLHTQEKVRFSFDLLSIKILECIRSGSKFPAQYRIVLRQCFPQPL